MDRPDIETLSPEAVAKLERLSLKRTSFRFKRFVADDCSNKAICQFDESQEEAIWGLDEDLDRRKSLVQRSMSEDMLRDDRILRPAHYISLLREANDTEVAGLEWDPDLLEIRIDWRSMFDMFLGEELAWNRDFQMLV